uniref:Dynactin subunit 2 n=1 Tax=Haemonchus contortus TaxID=6289 RepID=A0A7I5E9C3_HAECO
MSVTGKEDVYESEDLPESEQFINNFAAKSTIDSTDNENIELIHLDIDAARKRFKDRTLNTRNIDFSDSIAKRRGKSYGSSMYVLEVVGKDYGEPETTDQKYNRIAIEIDELAQQLQEDSAKSNSTVNESSIAALADELKAVKVSKVSGGVRASKENEAPTKTSTSPDGKLLSLEQRLHVRFRLDVLNPSYIEGMETKLNSIISKLDQVDDKRQKSVDGEMETKVNDLLELMSKWDVVCAAMPSNLKKLQGLHRLHEQAQHFSERLSQLVGVRDQIEKAIAADRMAMCELQVKAKEDISALLGQVTNLEERLKKIEKK